METIHLEGISSGAAREWQVVQGHCMSSGAQNDHQAAENRRLRDEVRELREDLRRLTLRVDHQGDQISELSASVVTSASTSQISGPVFEAEPSSIPPAPTESVRSQRPPRVLGSAGGYTWAEREAVARDIGAFLRRSLDGANRGESGRDRLKNLQSRVYVVVRDKEDRVLNPVRLCKTFSEVRALCHRGDDWGDSIFIGLPSQAEAAIAVSAAGLGWPSPEQ